MTLVGFEPTIPGHERPRIHSLEHAATGISPHYLQHSNIQKITIAGHPLVSAVRNSTTVTVLLSVCLSLSRSLFSRLKNIQVRNFL